MEKTAGNFKKRKEWKGGGWGGGWHFSASQSLCANKQNVCQWTEALSALAGLPVTHFESSSQQEGWVGFSLNKIKWGKENKKRSKRKPCLGGSFDTGKISPWRGLILSFFPPLLSQKAPSSLPNLPPSKVSVCVFVILPAAGKNTGFLSLSFPFWSWNAAAGVWSICWGSGYKQHPNFTTPPSSGTAERWKHGYFFPL